MSAVGWKYVLIKPNRLIHKETLNGLNQIKGFEQSSKVSIDKTT